MHILFSGVIPGEIHVIGRLFFGQDLLEAADLQVLGLKGILLLGETIFGPMDDLQKGRSHFGSQPRGPLG